MDGMTNCWGQMEQHIQDYIRSPGPGGVTKYTIGDGSRAGRGDKVRVLNASDDYAADRACGEVIVIDGEWAWVQWPTHAAEPFKYPLAELGLGAPLPFKDFFEAKHGRYPGKIGDPLELVTSRLAEAFAEYVDMLWARGR